MSITRLMVYLFMFNLCTTWSQSTASDQVTRVTLDAQELGGSRTVWIYLPKSYHNTNKAYPVYYMHDGQNLFDKETSYVGEWQIDEYLDTQSANETIIIGIEHGGNERINELTPFPNQQYGGGKAEPYIAFLMETVIPYVNSNYRTLKGAVHTTIAGSSLGGLLSFYLWLYYPQTFGKAAVLSPSFWFSESIYTFAKTNAPHPDQMLYLAMGTEESASGVADVEKMAAQLKLHGMNNDRLLVEIKDGGQHNERHWAQYFKTAYQFLSGTED